MGFHRLYKRGKGGRTAARLTALAATVGLAFAVLMTSAGVFPVSAETMEGGEGNVLESGAAPENGVALGSGAALENGAALFETFGAAEVVPDGAEGSAAVSDGAWYDGYVDYVLQKGYMGYLDSGDFGAEEPMTRAMFVSALYEMSGAECALSEAAEQFGDVDGGEWFAPALSWASKNGIIRGMDGMFCPDLSIDREMIAVMVQRASSVLGILSVSDWSFSIDYADLADISEWAVDGVAYCSVFGIMSGDPDGCFAPKRVLTRAEAAALMQRVDENLRGTDASEQDAGCTESDADLPLD